MKRSLYLLVSAGCAMMLAGCGQKGALYLPEGQRNVAVTPAAATPAAATPAAATPAAVTPATPAAATPAAVPDADNAAAGAAPPAPADNSDPQSPRRSNTAPRTN